MDYYRRFRKLKIDHGCLGIQLLKHYANYYCTPKGEVIIGSAGVDGIHYCTIPEFGEIIFAVNPMDIGDGVHLTNEAYRIILHFLCQFISNAE